MLARTPPPRFACIVGAPRCGTTTLAGFLQDHPEVCFSSPKEPHFFSRHDLNGSPGPELRRIVEDDYLARYFPHRPADAALLAEGSVSYLYAAERMAPLLRMWPEARFVIALRDPMQMLPSLHRRLLYTGDETVRDFHRAWALMPERARGRAIPRSCIDPRMLQYEQVGRLGEHVERFFDAVGRDRCFIALFDDLAQDPAALHGRLLDFLGLSPRPLRDPTARRASAGVRLGWLQRLLKRPPVATRMVLAGEKYRQRVKPLNRGKPEGPAVRAVFAARRKLIDWNRTTPPPVQLSPALQADIRDRLSGDVAHLGRLIGRDLGGWLNAGPAGAPRPGARSGTPADGQAESAVSFPPR